MDTVRSQRSCPYRGSARMKPVRNTSSVFWCSSLHYTSIDSSCALIQFTFVEFLESWAGCGSAWCGPQWIYGLLVTPHLELGSPSTRYFHEVGLLA